jgi:hypothetical protein
MGIRALLTTTSIADLIAEFIPHDFYAFIAVLNDA